MSATMLPHVGAVVDDRAAAIYHYVVKRGWPGSVDVVADELDLTVDEVSSAVHRLAELRLLRADKAEPERLVPTPPELAATLLISPIERAIYQRRELADRLRDQIEAITRPAVEVTEQVGTIECLPTAAEIRGLCKLAADTCRGELRVLMSAHEDAFDDLVAPCYGALGREVSVRVLGPHRVRAGFALRATANRLLADGAQIRTLSQIPRAAVVFDDTLAVVFDGPDAWGQPAARGVRDHHVVRFLIDLFDQLWADATPFSSAEPGYAGVADDLQRSVARLMAQGLTDEVVARRLGMSLRTCRRHIAALLQNLESVSRFQAGVRAAHQLSVDSA